MSLLRRAFSPSAMGPNVRTATHFIPFVWACRDQHELKGDSTGRREQTSAYCHCENAACQPAHSRHVIQRTCRGSSSLRRQAQTQCLPSIGRRRVAAHLSMSAAPNSHPPRALSSHPTARCSSRIRLASQSPTQAHPPRKPRPHDDLHGVLSADACSTQP